MIEPWRVQVGVTSGAEDVTRCRPRKDQCGPLGRDVGDLDIAVIEASLTDVAAQKHYETTQIINHCPSDWCEYDTSKPWYVTLDAGQASIAMRQRTSPLDMAVDCKFETKEGSTVEIHLDLQQEGPPLLVWGNGRRALPKGGYNDYYSLTNLKADGRLRIQGAEITHDTTVHGVTWMDHEYGGFPASYNWIWNGVRLSNGVSVLNYTLPRSTFEVGAPIHGQATLLFPDGSSHLVDSSVVVNQPKTMHERQYFEEVQIHIGGSATSNQSLPEIEGSLTLKSLMPDQVILGPKGEKNVYEGVASCTGSMSPMPGQPAESVTGTAWIEEKFSPVSG